MNFSFNGILNIRKPAGITSTRVVSMVKRLLPRGTKVGHAGTLDPFATGVLLLLIGKATKRCEEMMHQPKQYEATLKFGANTETDDPESPETAYPNAQPVTIEQIEQVLPTFVGTIQQMPPVYSALKVKGRRACDRVRDGQTVQLQARAVRIDRIDVVRFDPPLLTLKVDCGRGTYIRSLARDIGEALHAGAYLTALCRTRVGDYWVTDAENLETLVPEKIPTLIR